MKRVLGLLVLALILAGGAGVAMYAYLSGAEQRALDGYTMTKLLFSTGDIPAGTSLGSAQDQGLVELKDFPENFAPENALTSVPDNRRDEVTPVDLAAGQVLLVGDFVPAQDAPELLEVPDGQIAMSISLDAAPRVGAFLAPGSRVAVYSTGPVDVDGRAVLETRVLFPELLVLAVAGVTEDGGIFDVDTQTGQILVTVAVDPGQSARLVNAIESSSVYLSLLSEDTTVPIGTAVRSGVSTP